MVGLKQVLDSDDYAVIPSCQRVAVAELDAVMESPDWPGLVIRLGDLPE